MQNFQVSAKIQMLNVISHLVGFPILLTVTQNSSSLHVTFFLLTCFVILGGSVAYHMLCHLYPKTRNFDRAAILFAIPIFMFLFLDMSLSLFAIPIAVLSSIFFAYKGIKMLMGRKDNESITNVIIVILSWPCAILLMSSPIFFGFFLGGIFYSLGLVAYILDKRWPIMHVVWHACVVTGMSLHAAAIAGLI